MRSLPFLLLATLGGAAQPKTITRAALRDKIAGGGPAR